MILGGILVAIGMLVFGYLFAKSVQLRIKKYVSALVAENHTRSQPSFARLFAPHLLSPSRM